MSADRISSISSFGPLLRRYRIAAGLTQEELAARAGLSVRGISDLERGLKRTPRHDTVILLAEALALSPHKRALLEAAARPMAEGAPAGAGWALARPPHNLPTQLTPLIGRESETQAASEALGRQDVRLLTLTGSGGVGKTRLALQVAEDALERFEDGVYVVMLAALRDPTLVTQGIAEAVGLRATPDASQEEQLHEFLREKQTLLLLDNFEQVLEAATQVAVLLAVCPRIKALVTSREPLRIGGEHEQPVAPLASEAASELFVRQAQAVNATLDVAPESMKVVDAICARVDRLPLAIELAAVWAKVLPLPTLLERLSRRLDLLTGGRRDAPERQRTLRGAIEWSERLLEPQEQRLFRRLAVFAGGCTPEAAEAVCGGGEDAGIGAGGSETLAGLASLVEKSLLHAETQPDRQGDPDDARFWMLETIREYALDRLRASGEEETLRRRHADYYLRVVRELSWVGFSQDTQDRRLERELPNARVALEWARERGEALIGLGTATALGRYWYSRGVFEEGGSWLREMLALDAAAGERAAPPRLRVMALYSLILLTLDQHEYAQAEALAQEGLALARRNGDAGGTGNMLTELGHIAEARGDLDGAMALFEESLAQFRKDEQGGAVGRTLSSLGNLARERGEYVQARRYLEESLAWARERSFSWPIASGLTDLGHVACEQGEYTRAAALYRESLGLYRSMRNPMAVAWCLEGVAVVAGAAGEYERVARLCGAIASLREMAKATQTNEWAPFERAGAAAREALGEREFAAAYAAGAALSLAQAISYALAGMRGRAQR